MLYFHIPDQFCLARKYDIQNISLMCDHLDQLCQKVVICMLQSLDFLFLEVLSLKKILGWLKKALFISP